MMKLIILIISAGAACWFAGLALHTLLLMSLGGFP